LHPLINSFGWSEDSLNRSPRATGDALAITAAGRDLSKALGIGH
jgi:hypothetical protein